MRNIICFLIGHKFDRQAEKDAQEKAGWQSAFMGKVYIIACERCGSCELIGNKIVSFDYWERNGILSFPKYYYDLISRKISWTWLRLIRPFLKNEDYF